MQYSFEPVGSTGVCNSSNRSSCACPWLDTGTLLCEEAAADNNLETALKIVAVTGFVAAAAAVGYMERRHQQCKYYFGMEEKR